MCNKSDDTLFDIKLYGSRISVAMPNAAIPNAVIPNEVVDGDDRGFDHKKLPTPYTAN